MALFSNEFYVKLLLLAIFYNMKFLLFNFLLIAGFSFGQNLQLQSGSFSLPIVKDNAYVFTKADIYRDRAHVLVQFYSIPLQEEKEKLEKSGIVFQNYIHQNAYYISVDKGFKFPKEAKIKSISSIQPMWKMSEAIAKKTYPSHAIFKKKNIRLILTFFPDIEFIAAQKELELDKIAIIGTQKEDNMIIVQIPICNISKLAKKSFIQFIEPISPEPVKENYTGTTLIKMNQVHRDKSDGSVYSGRGINVMMQDDGIIGPHIDYTGRNTHFVTNNLADHGDHVAGIIMGAGNLNPLHRGIAWGAQLYTYDASDANYNNIPTLYNNLNITITSKSYAQTCNGGYTAICNQLDKQTIDYPSLLHFFSAGNTGTSNCGYGAGANWGNITGGHKSAKNVLAVGNTDLNGVLAGSSSRGPATDGRIKPDICAKGSNVMSTTSVDVDASGYTSKTGTSMSCPMASGTMAVLYEAYRKWNGGALPYNALMKGILMNTADDYGNPGPDYLYGYGIVNGGRALEVIKNKNYLIDSITQGGSKTHLINIPVGTKKVKIMVYWNDRQAAAGAKPAIVNNIDISGEINSTVHRPLRLDPKPTVASLSTKAWEGIDSLNNVEQLVIENPTGICSLKVDGFSIPFGPQKYCVIYDFIQEGIRLTYPQGNEKWKPGDQETVRWESQDTSSPITLRYSTNNGTTWNNISTNISAKTRSWAFSVPNILTNTFKVAILQNGDTDTSDAGTHVMNVPTGLTVQKNCGDSMILSWAATTGATGYIVYKLGKEYMDSFAFTTSNRYIKVCSNPSEANYYAVAAVHSLGHVGRRGLAILKNGNLLNCSAVGTDLIVSRIIRPLTSLNRNCDGNLTLNISAKVNNISNTNASNFKVFYQIDNLIPVSTNFTGTLNLKDSATVNFPVVNLLIPEGLHQIKIWTQNPLDVNICNDTMAKSFTINSEGVKTFVAEDFETFDNCGTSSDCGATVCLLKNGWANGENGVNDSIDWRVNFGKTPSGFSTSTGPSVDANPGTTTGKYVYLEANSCVNKFANLISPCINLDSMKNPKLIFKSHLFGANMGALHVDLYDGTKWILDIIPVISGNKGDVWNASNVNLSAYSGVVNIRFRGYTANGSLGDMAIDDIFIFSDDSLKAQCEAILPACVNQPVTFINKSINAIYQTWDFGIDATPRYSSKRDSNTVVYASPGIKQVRLAASNTSFVDTFDYSIEIQDKPIANFSYQVIGNEFIGSNSSLNQTESEWIFGDGNSSFENNPKYKYANPGLYNVKLIATGDCGVDSISKSIQIFSANINSMGEESGLLLSPNPTIDVVRIKLKDNSGESLDLELSTTEGKILMEKKFVQSDIIHMDAYPKGIYYLKVRGANRQFVEKLVKE